MRSRIKKINLIVILSVIFTSASNADVNAAVDNYFKTITADVNGPTIVHNQSAGIISGGGFATRSQSVDLQLGYITPPGFNTSCGNVNFYTGSFSFMTNTDQLIKFIQNTLMTAGVTAVMTALKSATPNIAGTLQSMIDQANQLMGMFNNSCQLGTALGNMVGNPVGEAVAKTTGQSLDGSGDMSGAMINNSTGGSAAQSITANMKKVTDAYQNWVSQNASSIPPGHDALTQEIADKYGSIIWRGLQANSHFTIPSSNNGITDLLGLANLIVSITGDVVIYSPTGDGISIASKSIPPKIEDLKQFVTGKGAAVKVYNCTKFDPMSPTECTGGVPSKNLGDLNYPATANYDGNIVKTIQQSILDIQDHFVSDKALSSNDLFIISISSTPIYAIAQTLDDIGMSSSINFVLSQYSEQIAFELLSRLLNMSLSMAQHTIVSRTNKDTVDKVSGLQAYISGLQSQLNSMQGDFVKVSPVEMLQQLNYLKSYAQNQMSPEIMQQVNFAHQLTNY